MAHDSTPPSSTCRPWATQRGAAARRARQHHRLLRLDVRRRLGTPLRPNVRLRLDVRRLRLDVRLAAELVAGRIWTTAQLTFFIVALRSASRGGRRRGARAGGNVAEAGGRGAAEAWRRRRGRQGGAAKARRQRRGRQRRGGGEELSEQEVGRRNRGARMAQSRRKGRVASAKRGSREGLLEQSSVSRAWPPVAGVRR